MRVVSENAQLLHPANTVARLCTASCLNLETPAVTRRAATLLVRTFDGKNAQRPCTITFWPKKRPCGVSNEC